MKDHISVEPYQVSSINEFEPFIKHLLHDIYHLNFDLSSEDISRKVNKDIISLKNYINKDMASVVIFKKQNVNIGFIWYFKLDDYTVHINQIGIEKEFRGKGIGSVMLEKFENQLIHKGTKQIELNCNIKISEFYIKNGFYIQTLKMVKEL